MQNSLEIQNKSKICFVKVNTFQIGTKIYVYKNNDQKV